MIASDTNHTLPKVPIVGILIYNSGQSKGIYIVNPARFLFVDGDDHLSVVSVANERITIKSVTNNARLLLLYY